jgi:tetratricopeptide (TPR) repeat protein
VITLALIGFGVFYYLSQRIDSGPTQVERIVATSEAAVRENPNDVSARLALAAAYLKSARPEDAKAQFLEILKAEPNNRSALLGVGGLLYDSGDLAGAKDRYSAVINVSGGGEFAGADIMLQEAYYFRVMSEYGLKDYAAGAGDLKKALTIDKADADSWYALGKVQLAAGDGKAAADSFQQALLFVPTGWCDPYSGLKAAYEQQQNAQGVKYASALGAICNGDQSDAQRQTLTGLTQGEFKIPALLGLGMSAETAGDTAAAAKWYGEILKTDPKNIAANAAIARIAAGTTGHAAGSTPTPNASAS